MQKLFIAGTVGRDAELRRTNNGDPVLSFSVAVDNGKDRNGNKRDATWYDASIWGTRAEKLQPYITKGLKMTLTGRPTARAHDGRGILGISVDDFTFQGGGQDRRDTGSQGGGYGSGGRPGDGMDDDLPF